MIRRSWFAGLALMALAAVVGAAGKAAAPSSGLDRLKKLAGTWVAADDKGQPTAQVVSVFKVTSAGSAVQETIFPGTDHEMVSLYYRDGQDVVMTHYCAMGNQPQMKLDPASAGNRLDFKFVGGSNINPAKDMHMHEGSIIIVDDDHIEWKWSGWQDGKASDAHKVALKLIRKK
jgi:hypothetical protein